MKHLFYSLLLASAFFLNSSCRNPSASEKPLANKEVSKVKLPKNGFYCGLTDSKGNLWLGSRGGGLFCYNEKGFTHYTTENGLCDNNISCLYEDHSGNLWLGTPKGACRWDGQSFTILPIPQSDTSSVWLDEVYPVVNPNQVMSIIEDNSGNLWLGTNGAGVYQYSNGKFIQHLDSIGKVYKDGQYHNIVLSMTEDHQGNLWFASLSHGGISCYDGEKFSHFITELSDDFVRVVYCDQKGNIWAGTHGNQNGGLDRYDGSFKAFYKTDDGMLHNNVRWLYEDSDNQLWIGSGTTDLSVFDGQHFSIFKDSKGNTYPKILFIVGDSKGDIWFGNSKGLWRYSHGMMESMTIN